MSLPHAILGFLQVMPFTGYDLKTRIFDRTVAHFWPAVQPQIYRELEKLEEHGWVTSQIEPQLDRPNRRVYTITDAGRVAFAGWMQTVQPLPAYRDAFLIQVFFAAQLSNAELVALLRGQLVARQERLAAYRALEWDYQTDTVHRRRERLAHLTLELGMQLESAYIGWLESAISVAVSLPDDPAASR